MAVKKTNRYMDFKCMLSLKRIKETDVYNNIIIMSNTSLCILKPKCIYQVTCLAFSYQAQTFVHAEVTPSSEVMDTKSIVDPKDYHTSDFRLSVFIVPSILH